MRVSVSWTNHNRRYTIDLQHFLKQIGIEVSEDQLKAAARKLLEQNEMEPEDPDH